MSDPAILILLYVVGLLMLVAEIFIPSHGILTVAGVGFLVAAIVQTFSYAGREAGIVAIFACLVFLPTFAGLAIKYWHRTPIGRRIAPPNPVAVADASAAELRALIGTEGRSATPLRPVGICVFSGRRISCVADFGIIDADVAVKAVSVRNGNLAVREQPAKSATT